MTRRSDKQIEHAFYVPDGDGGQVWEVREYDDVVALFSTEQTADQYAEWYGKAMGMSCPPTVSRRRIHTKMKRMT